jgi:prevent-host-death family protein
VQTINLFQAKTHLSKLIDQIASGKETEFIIARNGKPVARVVPIAPADTTRRIGIAKGEFVVPDNIDQHNEEVGHLFVGETPTDAPAA